MTEMIGKTFFAGYLFDRFKTKNERIRYYPVLASFERLITKPNSLQNTSAMTHADISSQCLFGGLHQHSGNVLIQ